MKQNKIEYRLSISDPIEFEKNILIHVLGILELHKRGIADYQMIWDCLLDLFPEKSLRKMGMKIKLIKILASVPGLDTIKENFPDNYSMAAKRLKKRVLKELESAAKDRTSDADGRIAIQLHENNAVISIDNEDRIYY